MAGLFSSLKAMRLPKHSLNDSHGEIVGEKDLHLARRLILAGTDHAKFSRGIVVWLKMEFQVGWMIEFETYRHGVECLSTSSAMLTDLKKLKGRELAEQKQRDLPYKSYTRIVTLSYQALRGMYRARLHHRHPDWGIMCGFIETLPYFESLIYPEGYKSTNDREMERR